MPLPKKCTYHLKAKTLAAREAGCPLDHCACHTHDAKNERHGCHFDDAQNEMIRDLERAAGWDPNP